ncbi:hypothetical protein OR16_01425 [Cupriavidus basilensis OR16]|uniref:Uncharacterized protein n=1 Tax=Cupriavidus basilensis OR16 TaxID=1127483 RepID=H1RYF8_9BURK|nr:hypothetical protein [Cupriavidus basilensis]EHP44649.1 hypothetical protein OR16_01425 [Cupriavidus basilensis OR16]
MLILIYCSYAVACIFALWRAARWVDKHHPALRDSHPPRHDAVPACKSPETDLPPSQRIRLDIVPAGRARLAQRPAASAAASMVL